MYKYGLIGNCQVSALINRDGAIDWLCLPRPDSPPVFGRLLDSEGGVFSVESEGRIKQEQWYVPNTNVLLTTIEDRDGNVFRITDFCPRFQQFGRMYRPNSIFRIIEPVRGNPRIKISCRPVSGWDKQPIKPVRGNSHLRFDIRGEYLRVATNMSLTYLCDEIPVALTEPLYFALTWDTGLEDDLVNVTRNFLDQTIQYWRTWVQHCSIPSLYQEETIRSALTLKLHCYEDTGAILAALTTSLPEENGNGRNWDYRFCWLRDSYFVLSAFHNLGHFEEMEGFLKFFLGIASRTDKLHERLSPVYSLDQKLPLPETEHPSWQGFEGSGPVRSNNQAAEHVQNDVYGEMVLTLAPIFFDKRFRHLRTAEHEDLLNGLVRSCIRSIGQADAGLWELRNGWQEHSFSNLMCWAGIERSIRLRSAGFLGSIEDDLISAKARAEAALSLAVREGSLRNGPRDPSFDAALLQLPLLRFPDKEISRKTVLEIAENLKLGEGRGSNSFLYRYCRNDDFGSPKSSFLMCSFWLAQALSRIGESVRAAEVMDDAVAAANHLGLFSEHYLPEEARQCGNFPQAYSHVGLINAAFAISPPWSEVL